MSLTSLALSRSRRDFLERATAAYQAQLDEEAAGYLIGRGLDREAADGFRLGVVREAMPGHEDAIGRISIPYLSGSGDVVAMKFRRIDGNPDMKYWGEGGQVARLFNSRDLFRPEDFVLLVEGETDCVTAGGMLKVPAVAIPGASSFKDHWPRCFADFDRVLIVFDNDYKEDGSNPGQKAARKWADLIPQATVIPPPVGLDLSEWVLRDGPEAVMKGLGLLV
jgi:DNA primase